MKKWTAKVKVDGKVFNAKATADSALDAKYKIVSAALSANPGKDIFVSEIREAEITTVTDFFSNIFGFQK